MRISKELAVSFVALGAGSYGYSFFIEPGWVDVNEVEINLPSLPEAFSGFRILQLSDIHMGGWMNRERLAETVQLALAQQVDLIALTGDYLFGHSWNSHLELSGADFVEEISELTREHLTLGILGNHDHWTNAEFVREMLTASGVIELENDVFPLEQDNQRLFIAGVDDIWEKKYDLERVTDKLPRDGAAILLAHEPDFADVSAKTGRFDLQLSGHSHGGQVVIPFFGAPILPHLGEKYYSGLYKVRDMWQYTNRGIGMIEPAVRLNCRPEITVFTLRGS
ncbi:MAG: metallophosphoesterase [Chloroflexi bacterium]|nr:metallophosphoesterase [Chloroflexota bacterium]